MLKRMFLPTPGRQTLSFSLKVPSETFRKSPFMFRAPFFGWYPLLFLLLQQKEAPPPPPSLQAPERAAGTLFGPVPGAPPLGTGEFELGVCVCVLNMGYHIHTCTYIYIYIYISKYICVVSVCVCSGGYHL